MVLRSLFVAYSWSSFSCHTINPPLITRPVSAPYCHETNRVKGGEVRDREKRRVESGTSMVLVSHMLFKKA